LPEAATIQDRTFGGMDQAFDQGSCEALVYGGDIRNGHALRGNFEPYRLKYPSVEGRCPELRLFLNNLLISAPSRSPLVVVGVS